MRKSSQCDSLMHWAGGQRPCYRGPCCRERSAVQHNNVWEPMTHIKQNLRQQPQHAELQGQVIATIVCTMRCCSALANSQKTDSQQTIDVLHSKNRCSTREERQRYDPAMAHVALPHIAML